MEPILYWNNVALEANRRDINNSPDAGQSVPEHGRATPNSRALAIVHLAMYDAYAGVINSASLPRFLSDPASPPLGASAEAAVAGAAHACLSALYPRQKAYFDSAHLAAGLAGSGLAEGHYFGLAVARAVLNDRAGNADAKSTLGQFTSSTFFTALRSAIEQTKPRCSSASMY